jgi:FAD/FMN-containing dehydrogenase
MTKTEVADKLALKLFATETAVDDAMVRACQLLEGMVEARQALNVSGVVGEVAQARVAEAIAALSEARRAVMASHNALADVQRKMDVTVSISNPTKPTETTGSAAPLRVAG